MYLGGDASIDAAQNLFVGSSEHVDDTAITFKQIHDAIHEQTSVSLTDAIDEPELPDTEAANGDQEQQYNGSNFVSLSDLSKKTSTLGSAGISFLNESEIEGVHLHESPGVVANTGSVAAPGQTLAVQDGNNAAETLDWSGTNVMRTNWADEETSEPAKTEEVIASIPSAAALPNDDALQSPTEFRTIEKKSVHKDGTRGRVSGD